MISPMMSDKGRSINRDATAATAYGELQVPDIEFGPSEHVYTLSGTRLPSVTQIMEPMSLMLYRNVPPDVMAAAADRGTRAHEQVSNYVRYGLLETDEDTEPYLEAYQRFESDYRPIWAASEYRTYHRVMRYAGTLDLIGYVEPDTGEGYDVVDIKCTRMYHAVMLETQLGGYVEAIKSHGLTVRKRYGLQLLRDGTYRFERVVDGYKVFLHCLAIYNEMKREEKP